MTSFDLSKTPAGEPSVTSHIRTSCTVASVETQCRSGLDERGMHLDTHDPSLGENGGSLQVMLQDSVA